MTPKPKPDQAEGLREQHGYELQTDPELPGYCKVKGLVIRTDNYGAHWIPEPQARMIAAGPKMQATLDEIADRGCLVAESYGKTCDKMWTRDSWCNPCLAREAIANVEAKP